MKERDLAFVNRKTPLPNLLFFVRKLRKEKSFLPVYFQIFNIPNGGEEESYYIYLVA